MMEKKSKNLKVYKIVLGLKQQEKVYDLKFKSIRTNVKSMNLIKTQLRHFCNVKHCLTIKSLAWNHLKSS